MATKYSSDCYNKNYEAKQERKSVIVYGRLKGQRDALDKKIVINFAFWGLPQKAVACDYEQQLVFK